jgi:putative transposase
MAYGVRSNMGNVGAYGDNAVVDRRFRCLKHHWIFNMAQATCEHMKKVVAVYMRYYTQNY